MLRRGMINLVSMWASKNNFDSSDVLTGQVNFGTTKGTFLYFFFRGHIQLSLIKAAAHKGGICLIILALTEVCTDNLDSQPLLVWCQCTCVYACEHVCVPSVVCLLLMYMYASSHDHFYFLAFSSERNAAFWKAEKKDWKVYMIEKMEILGTNMSTVTVLTCCCWPFSAS